jgi:hypothetical protein
MPQDPAIDEDIWDDSELVKAYDEAVISYRQEMQGGGSGR